MRYAYLDTETTGLHPGNDKGEIIEIAIINVDDGMMEKWVTKIKPQHIETAHPKALEINGYNADAWKDAPTFEEIAPEIHRRLNGAIVVGHNVNFDLKFLDHHFNDSAKRMGHSLRLSHRNIIDTVTLAQEHLRPTGLKSVSMDNIRRWLGWSLNDAHTALKDADDVRKLHNTLHQAGWLKRWWWSWRGPKNMQKTQK